MPFYGNPEKEDGGISETISTLCKRSIDSSGGKGSEYIDCEEVSSLDIFIYFKDVRTCFLI